MILFKPTVQFWMCGWWIKNNLSPGMKEKRRNWEKRYSFIFFLFHHTSIPQIYIGSASTLLNYHSLITEFEKCRVIFLVVFINEKITLSFCE